MRPAWLPAIVALVLQTQHASGQEDPAHLVPRGGSLDAEPDGTAPAETASDTTQPVVAIDCPAFGQEPRAALDARARAELLVRETQGTFVVLCSGAHADLTWHSSARGPFVAQVPLQGDPAADVERLLGALDELLDRSAASSLNEELTVSPPAAPRRPAVAPGTEPPPAPLARSTLELALGARGEVWSENARGALGPRLGVAWTGLAPLGLGAGVGAVVGLRSEAGVAARVVRGDLGAEYRPYGIEGVRLGVTVNVDSVHAAGKGQSTNAGAVGGSLSVGYGVALGPFVLAAAPSLLAHLGPVRIRLGESEVFRIPAFTAALGLDVDWAPSAK